MIKHTSLFRTNHVRACNNGRIVEKMKEELSKEFEHKLKTEIESLRSATQGMLILQFICTNIIMFCAIHDAKK